MGLQSYDGHEYISYDRVKQVQNGFVDMLSKYDFKYMFTLNYNVEMAMQMSPMRAKDFFRKYIKHIYKDNVDLSWFFVVQAYQFGGYHGHGLITESYRSWDEMSFKWRSMNKKSNENNIYVYDGKRSGYIRFSGINGMGGTVGYITRYITSSICDYEVNLKEKNLLESVPF